jgi:cell division protein FtsA
MARVTSIRTLCFEQPAVPIHARRFAGRQQIVLTGGASQIPGLDGLASRILGSRVRMGRPLRVQGLPQAATGPAFSSAVGLCLFAAHPQDEWWDFDIPAERYPARSIKRAFRWFKDNW